MNSHYDEKPHTVVVTGSEGEVEYDVQHLPECRLMPDEGLGREYDCGVWWDIVNTGVPDCFTGYADRHLPPGTYHVWFWHDHGVSTPWSPAEYSAGLEVEPQETTPDLGDSPATPVVG